MKTAFDSLQIGPLHLRNRFIRSAAFEGMAKDYSVTEDLINYHAKVASGGVGMTTVAYASISRSGLAFQHQLLIEEKILPDLQRLVKAIHSEGAKASIQIGHTGNMSKKSVCGVQPIAPTGHFNIYGPSKPRKMNEQDIEQVIDDFKKAVSIVKQAGFDAVEIHAGHGYLISQFLSPYTNKRKDEYGGSFENRSRFLKRILIGCKEVAGSELAILVKMNMHDGFIQGITEKEALDTACIIEACGADAVVLSGGFVSKSPLYIMRGEIPPSIMAYHIKNMIVKLLVRLMGYQLMKPIPFYEGYFLEQAKKFREKVKIPIVVVGGLSSKKIINKALDAGFDGIGIARALIENEDFVNNLKNDLIINSSCTYCNYCVAVMYSGKMRCFKHDTTAPKKLLEKAASIHHE